MVFVSGQTTLLDAFHAINLDVMFFLFGMFIIGQALEESRYSACSIQLFQASARC